ncbi:glycosyltransferase family 39 protein [Candidatus Poribacteria bacterium]|nr:glycosyltransferase family 39 protein [Candidatus Poribacteria bacterium]
MLSRLNKPVFSIFLLAIILRVSYIYFFLGFSTSPNEHDLWLEKLAVNISHNEGFGLTKSEPTARKLPLFPIFLAFIYTIFGHSVSIARIFQILLGAFSVAGIYLIAETIFEEKRAVLCAAILACDPLYIYLSGWFLTENLFIPLIIYFLYFILKYQLYDQKKHLLILAGVCLGLAALTRASLTVFPLFIFMWSYIINYENKNKIWKEILILFGAAYLFISIWTFRNYMVFNEIITTETGAGKMFWGANNPEAIGDVILMTGSPRLYESNERPHGAAGKDWREWNGSPWLNVFLSTWEGASEKQVDNKYFKKGWEWIREHPMDYISLLPRKIFYFWKFWSPHASFPDLPYGLSILAKCYYYIILLLALFGVYFSLLTWKKYLIFYLLIANFTLSTLLFFGDARQRMPIVPIIALFAGLGIGAIADSSWFLAYSKNQRSKSS